MTSDVMSPHTVTVQQTSNGSGNVSHNAPVDVGFRGEHLRDVEDVNGRINMGRTNMGRTNMGRTSMGRTNMVRINMGRTNMGRTNMGRTNMARTWVSRRRRRSQGRRT
jgi:hypothetical protein